MKKTLNRILAILLTIVMIITSVPLTGFEAKAEELFKYGNYYFYPQGTQFISSIRYGQAAKSADASAETTLDNHIKLDVDLNSGISGKDYIFLGYKTSTNINDAMATYLHNGHNTAGAQTTQFTVNGKSLTFTATGLDTSGMQDLNADAGGDYIYLYATKDAQAGLPVTAISASASGESESKAPAGYLTVKRDGTDTDSECNAGSGGDYVYIYFDNTTAYTDVTKEVLALKEKIEAAENLNQSDYTAESWANYDPSLLVTAKNYIAVYESNEWNAGYITPQELKNACDALDNALNLLDSKTYERTVSTLNQWNYVMSEIEKNNGTWDIILGNDIIIQSTSGGKLAAVPAGVTVNLHMNGHNIEWCNIGSGNDDIMSYSYPLSDNYWGLITNNGTLNIQGTGTIKMQHVRYNYKNGGGHYNDSEHDNYGAKVASIVNGKDAYLSLGSNVTVQSYLGQANTDGDGMQDMFLYAHGIYNEGTVDSSAKIDVGTFAGGTVDYGAFGTSKNSWLYAYSYGIFGGAVNVLGGSINSEAKSGFLDAVSVEYSKGNNVANFATGVYSNNAKILGKTSITTTSTSWRNKESKNVWGDGTNMSWSVGVMYSKDNYPVIGAAVDIAAKFNMIADDTFVTLPGLTDGWTVNSEGGPKTAVRRGYAVAGVGADMNSAMYGGQSTETPAIGGNVFGTNSSGSWQDANSTIYRSELDLWNNLGITVESSDNRSQTDNNAHEILTSNITNGAPGNYGSQYMVYYRYYDSDRNLEQVSRIPDESINTPVKFSPLSGVITDYNSKIDFLSGGQVVADEYYQSVGVFFSTYSADEYGVGFDGNTDAEKGAVFSGSMYLSPNNITVLWVDYIALEDCPSTPPVPDDGNITEIVNGSCGDNLTWTFDPSVGELRINGTGKMYDYSGTEDAPWYAYRKYIKSVSIDAKVTGIGSAAFYGCSNITDITYYGNESDWHKIEIGENNAHFIRATVCFLGCDHIGHNYVAERVDATDDMEAHTRYICTKCDDSYIVIDPASKIEGLQAFAGTYKISLSWLKAVEATVTGYNVYRKLSTDEEFKLIQTINSRNTTSFVDDGLIAGCEYAYIVTALKDELEGLKCDPVTCIPHTDEEEPRVLKIEPSKVLNDVITGVVDFAISAEDNIGVVKLELYYSSENSDDWQLISAYNGTATNVSFNTKSVADGSYRFKAIAYDSVGNSDDGSIVKTYTIDNTGPEKVKGLTTKAVYASKATIAWEKVSDKDIDHFILRKKTDTGYVVVSDSITGVLGYNLEKLSPDTEYTYSVAGVDHYGNIGEYSDDFAFVTLSDIIAPVITALSPSSGRYNNSISFKATATDDCAVKSITIQISSDGVDWEDIKTYTYSDNAASKTCIHSVSLNDYRDGVIYLRAVAMDVSDNESNTGATAPFVQYYVDKTAPSAPSGLIATGGDGHIQIKWNQSNESDLSGYYVYRSTEKNGSFTKISGKLTTLNHYDRNVNRDATYYYRVEAIDKSGNVSKQSDVVSAKALDDTIKPTIESISPATGTAISAYNNKIGVLANDNNLLKRVVVEYKYGDNYEKLETFDNVNASNKVVYTKLPVDKLNHGDVVYVRAYCVDVSGYTSEYSSAVRYVIDTVAPELTGLTYDVNNGICTLKWNDSNIADLSGYKVYRSIDGGSYKLLGSRSAHSSHSYTFNDTVGEGVYVYRIDCIDKAGNSASYYTDSITLTKHSQIVPVITSETYIEQGVQEIFSASKSTADNTIVSYLWDFGDGSTSDKMNVTKAYNEAGKYTVTLTVTDSKGNSSAISQIVTVAKRELLGAAKVRVVDENGRAISNAPVYFDLGADNQQIVYTNTSGYASLTMTAGTHVVGSYKNSYLPASGNITVLANVVTETTLTMVEQELITGEFEVHEMTFEEIVASGIDTNDPANQQIYEVTVTLIYGEEKIPVRYVRNDTEIISYTIGTSGGFTGGGKISNISYVPNEMNQEIIAVVEIPVTASYLKQFYSANLHIVNNAAAGYEIVNCEANISVPEGLTVVQHTPISSIIDGQQSSSANWILRGDKAGSYNLSANFSGVLDLFNVPVSASFSADEPVYVYGPETVKLRMEVNEELNEDLYFNLCLVNKRDVNVNCPRINAPEFVFNITERYNKIIRNETQDGIVDKVALCEFLRVGVISADGKAEFYDAEDDSQVPVDYLAPGESLIYEYVLKHVKNGQGGTGYFQKAIIDCDEFYKSSIEVVCMSEMPLAITENQFIKEHLEFIASSDYLYADLEFPARVSEALKEEWEDDWYEFIELDYSTNYAEVVLADYMLQKSTYDDMEAKYLEYFATESTDLYGSLARVVKEEYFSDYDDLTVDKIKNIFTGFDYESSEYKHMNTVFDKLPEDSVKNIYKAYYGFDLAMNVWEFGCDTVDSIKKTGKYIAAINAYRNCMDTYFKEVLNNASTHLGEDEEKMKEAIENFTSSENTAKFAEILCEEFIQTLGAISFSALKIVFMETFVDLVTIAASAAIKTIAAKVGLQIGSAGYTQLMNVVGGIAIGVSLGMSVSKILANTENLNYTASMMEYYSQLAEGLRRELKIREADFLSEPTSFEGALCFDSSYKAFKSAWLATAELFLNFAKGKNNALAVKIFNRDKFSDYINDSAARISSIKQLNCHASNHYVNTTSSKILMVECPVDVTIYGAKGNVLAIVTNDSVEIIDNRIVATNWESKKFIALPTDEDFNIRITAYEAGKMDYTVLEYLSDINIRRVVFEDIALEKDDVFEGDIDSIIFTEKDNYALTKNSDNVILPTDDISHEVTGIMLDKETVTMQRGENIKLTATVEPADVENAVVTWSSYDETIATVDENGVVSALMPGEVIVKAVTEDGGYVSYCTVIVECTEHQYGQWSILEDSSCEKQGLKTRSCEYCGFVDKEIIEVSEHTGGIASCSAQKICEICNESYDEYDQNNHMNIIIDDAVDATCYKNGLTVGSHCGDCNAIVEAQTVIPALEHIDNDGDCKCDNGCGYEYEKPVDPTPDKPEEPDDFIDNNCKHLCHKTGFMGFIWKIARFFYKLFKMNPVCECGAVHY